MRVYFLVCFSRHVKNELKIEQMLVVATESINESVGLNKLKKIHMQTKLSEF